MIDPFTRADPHYNKALLKGADHLPLAFGEVCELPRRRTWRWWLLGVALAALVIVAAIGAGL